MPAKFKPDDVRLSLSYPASTVPGLRHGWRVDVEAEHADNGEPLFRVHLTAQTFAALLSGHEVVVQSQCMVPRPNSAGCADTNSDHGDCTGRVRPYLVTGTSVAGYNRNEHVPLCASHAQFHGRKIRNAYGTGVTA